MATFLIPAPETAPVIETMVDVTYAAMSTRPRPATHEPPTRTSVHVKTQTSIKISNPHHIGVETQPALRNYTTRRTDAIVRPPRTTRAQALTRRIQKRKRNVTTISHRPQGDCGTDHLSLRGRSRRSTPQQKTNPPNPSTTSLSNPHLEIRFRIWKQIGALVLIRGGDPQCIGPIQTTSPPAIPPPGRESGVRGCLSSH